MSGQQTRLIRCAACGRLHLAADLIADPDRPPRKLCPVRWRGLRITPHERAEGNRLLQSAFSDVAAPGHEFPATDDMTGPADAGDAGDAADAADDWWSS